MATQAIRHPEFRAEFAPTNYPFSDGALLTNRSGDVIDPASFLDASLYPIGGGPRLRLANVNVTADTVTLTVGDEANAARASGSFSVVDPPAAVPLRDALGRPAGLLVSEPSRLAAFGAWALGDHAFTADQAEFVAACCIPTPEPGVRGVLLDDGTLLTGEVWVVGGAGVVLRTGSAAEVSGPGVTTTTTQIRIDVVGDPLYRRQLCLPDGLFTTPRVIKTVRVVSGPEQFDLTPDEYGNINISVHNAEAGDTVLRVRTTPGGIVFEAVGSSASGG